MQNESPLTRSGLKTDTSQMTPIFSHWQGELSEGIAQLFRGQINATSGEKRKSDEVVRFETASNPSLPR